MKGRTAMTNETSQIIKDMPKRNPTNGTFELTIRCNLHCKMCLFRHDDSENPELMAKELTSEQWENIAKQAAKAGTGSLLITGGEPMIRKDFCDIWERIYKQGFIITLYTNATLVTPDIMKTLVKYPPHKLGITLYGASEETYETVCGNGTAFYHALDGIHKLQELPTLMEFRTTIIKDNYHDVDAIEQLIKREFGEEYSLTQTRIVMKSVRGGCADVASCRLNPEDNIRLAFHRGINQIKAQVGDVYDENKLHLKRIVQKGKKSELKLSLLGCDAGIKEYTISWDGKLLACQLLDLFSTDVLQEGFEKAWEHLPFSVPLIQQCPDCIECRNKELCNCCVASRLAETGKVDGCPEYICQDTAIIQKLLNEGGIEYDRCRI